MINNEINDNNLMLSVNPWEHSYLQFCIGLSLIFFQIQIGDFYVPFQVVGSFLIFLSLRSFKDENSQLKLAFYASAFGVLGQISGMFLNASELSKNTDFLIISGAANSIFIIFTMLFWLRGIRKIYKKTSSGTYLAEVLICLYAFEKILILMGNTGIYILGVLLLSYLFIYIILYKQRKYLKKYGYSLKMSPIKIKTSFLVIGYIIIIVLGITVVSLYENISFEMGEDITERLEEFLTDDDDCLEVEEQLIELGFPEDVLKILPEDTVLMFEDAVNVYVGEMESTEGTDVDLDEYLEGDSDDNGVEIIENSEDEETNSQYYMETVFVRMSNEEVYLVTYVEMNDSGHYFRDGFQLQIDDDTMNCLDAGFVYEIDGKTYQDTIDVFTCVGSRNYFVAISDSVSFIGEIHNHINSTNRCFYTVVELEDFDYENTSEVILNYYEMYNPVHVSYTDYEEKVYSEYGQYVQLSTIYGLDE